MAVINIHGIAGGAIKAGVVPSLSLSNELDEMVYTPQLIPPVPITPRISLPEWSTSVVNNLPISEVEEAVSVKKAPSFLDDYYYRIHVLPGTLELGNLLSTQTRQVEVWNSYPSDQLLSSITASGVDGITMESVANPPTIFNELESRTYTLTISTNGSPVISATYSFNFPSDHPTLGITGRRVVMWPWMPQINHEEKMEWKTDILPSFNNEQRLALRTSPRQEFTFTFQMGPEQYSKAKAICTQWSQRVYGIPVWSELTRVGPLAAGSTQVVFDTSNADYRDNDIIILWESDTKFSAVETLEVLSDRINLKLPTEVSYSDVYVAPLRFARTYNGTSFKRNSHDITVVSSTFTVTQNKDLGASVGYIQYRGRDVLLEPLLALEDISERISRSLDLFDNGSGPVFVDIQGKYVRNTKVVVFDTLDRTERWKARKWIHSRRGKQKSFWIPSWNRDLILLEDAGSTSSSIVVKSIGYSLYYGVTDIMIQKKDGSRILSRVLSSSTDASGNEVLNLSSQLGVSVLVSSVDFICFLSLVRFDTDSIQLKHTYSGRATTNIPVVEVPE